MWMPREPDVFGQPTSPTASSASRHTSATSRTCDHGTPGTGSRSTRSSSGWSRSSARTGMRVEVDAAEVGDPGEAGRLVDDDLVGGAPGRERQRGGPDPVGRVVRRALLEERLLLGPVDEALERHRPAAHPDERPVGDGEEVADEVQLRVAGLREVELVRVADRDLAAADLEDLLPRRHGSDASGRGQAEGAAPPSLRVRPPERVMRAPEWAAYAAPQRSSAPCRRAPGDQRDGIDGRQPGRRRRRLRGGSLLHRDVRARRRRFRGSRAGPAVDRRRRHGDRRTPVRRPSSPTGS